ncbi:hypothetical protein [Agrobacterium rubi]|uniref:Uncharacterized protein n=1 Tax=Agrobacterium rubi TaxID=28099 RepID=A0ABX2IXU5_9HYPH|nr:hypothetical protein [Agrobacterium rubi]NTF35567.1 hypothetical protein [Agrobacterium rubi]
MNQMPKGDYTDQLRQFIMDQQQRQQQQPSPVQMFAQAFGYNPGAPQTAAQGYGQLAAGIGSGLASYTHQGAQFPPAPGGGTPSFATGLANFFTGRNNGGLK